MRIASPSADPGFEVTEDQVWHQPDEVVRLIEDARGACLGNLPPNWLPWPPIPRQVPRG
jgi:hypothetical protein